VSDKRRLMGFGPDFERQREKKKAAFEKKGKKVGGWGANLVYEISRYFAF